MVTIYNHVLTTIIVNEKRQYGFIAVMRTGYMVSVTRAITGAILVKQSGIELSRLVKTFGGYYE